jgi:hypothetical protein
MPNILTEIAAPEHLRSELESVPGVRRAFVDAAADRVYLICDAPAPGLAVERAAEAVLERAGLAAGAVDFQLSYAAAVDRRVRFVEMVFDRPRAGVGVATAVLEWAGERVEGRAQGEGGPAGELRSCAQATVHALEAILDGRLTLEVLGLKSTRIFDQDLVSVILRSAQAPDRRLVGVSLVLQDPHRSAALAVLNATNRLLGNYLISESFTVHD